MASALPRAQTKISVLSRFSGSSRASYCLPTYPYFMTPRSKRKVSGEPIRNGAAFFPETSADALREAGRTPKLCEAA
jgi:hypothetical protein